MKLHTIYPSFSFSVIQEVNPALFDRSVSIQLLYGSSAVDVWYTNRLLGHQRRYMKHLTNTIAAAAAAAAKAASDAADRHAANRRSFVHCFTALAHSKLSQLASPQARSELAYLPGYIAPWQSRLIILCAGLSFLDAVSTANHFYQQYSMNRKRI